MTTQVSPAKANYSKWPKVLAMAVVIFDGNIDSLDSLQNYCQPISNEQTDDKALFSVSSFAAKIFVWDRKQQIVLYCNSIRLGNVRLRGLENDSKNLEKILLKIVF
jgi:hypothetical protein